MIPEGTGSWRLTEASTLFFPRYSQQGSACGHLFANLAPYLHRKLLMGVLDKGGQMAIKWKNIFSCVTGR